MYPGAHAVEHGDKPALIMAGSGEAMSYAELDRYANRVAHLFRDAGLQAGDHIALCLENRLEFLALVWGAHYAGLFYTAISSRLTTAEIAYIVADCGARAYLTSPAKADQAAELLEQMPAVELRLSVGGPLDGYESLEARLAAQPTGPIADPTEGQDMLYSSGTTGRPKGVKVPLPNKPLGSPDNLFMLVAGLFGASADSVYLSPAPLYHAAPLRFCRTLQRLGGTVVVMEHFDPLAMLTAIERHRVTFTQVVPTMFVRLLKLAPEERARFDVSSLESVVHAAAPCPVPVKEQMIEWWGPIIHEYYAGTEGNGFCYVGSADWLEHKGTVGRPILGTLHIVDEDGVEVPAGEVGTVYFESDATFEYHNDPEKTASSRLANGWSTLGDMGKVDEDGYLYLTDRKAYMIISGGVNIYPQEAENVLTMHPAVLDVAVFGVPDDEMGESVKAVVQPVDLDAAGPDLEQALIAYCRTHLAGYKCPRSIDFRAELPRHPTGKLYKRLLRDEYWAGHGESRIS
jgi:acyl-CoA synthetase (AMP-forming)/AMP-acid ligase II